MSIRRPSSDFGLLYGFSLAEPGTFYCTDVHRQTLEKKKGGGRDTPEYVGLK